MPQRAHLYAFNELVGCRIGEKNLRETYRFGTRFVVSSRMTAVAYPSRSWWRNEMGLHGVSPMDVDNSIGPPDLADDDFDLRHTVEYVRDSVTKGHKCTGKNVRKRTKSS